MPAPLLLLSLPDLLGPNPGDFCASVIKRVLEIAVDPDHEDPRHCDHWWPCWKERPMDGCQSWNNNNELLDRSMVVEYNERTKMKGMLGSKLQV